MAGMAEGCVGDDESGGGLGWVQIRTRGKGHGNDRGSRLGRVRCGEADAKATVG